MFERTIGPSPEHRVRAQGSRQSLTPFVFAPRDPNFAHVEKEHAAGRNIYKSWLDYVPRVDKPLSLKRFYTRFQAWRAAGKPPQFSRGGDGAPVNVVSAAQSRSSASNEVRPTASGLAFVDQNGVALQVRRRALCFRFPDGSEQLFQSRDLA